MIRSAARRLLRAPRPEPVHLAGSEPVLPATLEGEQAEIRIRVDGVSALFSLVAGCSGRASTTRLTVEIAPWLPPTRDVALRLGHVSGLLQHSVRTTGGRLVAGVRVKNATDLSTLLAAVVPLASPVARAAHDSDRPDVALLVPAPDLAPFVATADRLITVAELDDERVRAADVLAVGPEAGAPSTEQASAVVVVRDDVVACVDPAVHRPLARASFDLPALRGRFTAAGELELVADDGTVVRPAGARNVTDGGVAALSGYVGVRFDAAPAAGLQERLLRQLSGAGLVVAAPARTGDPSGSALAEEWTRPWPADADALELASVRQRRIAHRDHSALRLAVGAPSVSVLLCSNRADHLEESLRGLAGLDYPRLQLVLGLHGIPEPTELDAWLAPVRAAGIDVGVHTFDGATAFGSVLADLSNRASGALLTKVDDDDHYAPDHVWDLVVAHEYSGAAAVGKGAEHVYLASSDTTVRRKVLPPEAYGRAVAGGTILIARSDLLDLGGWRPVPRAVDRALLDRILRDGAGIYRTHSFNYLYVRRPDGHTWVVDEEHFRTNVRRSWDGLALPTSD